MMILQQNGILKNYFLIVSLLFFINNSNKIFPSSLCDYFSSLLFSLLLLSPSLSLSVLCSLLSSNPKPHSHHTMVGPTVTGHDESSFILIISLLSLPSFSLVIDQRGGVEIGIQGLAQRQVFGCGVEIGVQAWQFALGWLFWCGDGHWGVGAWQSVIDFWQLLIVISIR